MLILLHILTISIISDDESENMPVILDGPMTFYLTVICSITNSYKREITF